MNAPDEFPCSDAEELDFLCSAGLLLCGALAFLFYGDDVARALNSLFLNL